MYSIYLLLPYLPSRLLTFTFSQQNLGLQQQLNAAAVAASVAAAAGLRQPLPNDALSILQESMVGGAAATPSGIMGSRPPNAPVTAEAILGRIQNNAAMGGLPPEQGGFGGAAAYYRALLQRGILNGESAGGAMHSGNALSSILGQSRAAQPAPTLARAPDYNSVLQISSEQIRQAMNREAGNNSFGSPMGRRHY